MHPCIERRVDVFRSINDFKNLSLMGKGHNDLTLRSQCRHAFILVLGREIRVDKKSMKNICCDGFFFLVSAVVECSNFDIDVKIDS